MRSTTRVLEGLSSETSLDWLSERLDIRAEAAKALDRLRKSVARPPCIVLLGEGNSGKTTLANKLLGGALLPTSVISNTRFPTLIRYADAARVTAFSASGARIAVEAGHEVENTPIASLEIGLPEPRLKRFELIDTPSDGPSTALLAGLDISAVRIPVWCTSATQAWKESERRAWMALDRVQRRHGVLAVTRLDRIVDEGQRERLIARLTLDAGPHFQSILCRPDDVIGTPTTVAALVQFASEMHEKRRRTIARLSNRVVDLANRALSPDDSSKLTVLGLRKSQC